MDVVVWNQQAEVCQQYLTKGSPLLVEGRLAYDEWKNQQGETRSRLRVTADRIQLIGPRPQGQGAEPRRAETAPPRAPDRPSVAATDLDPVALDYSNDDPPF